MKHFNQHTRLECDGDQLYTTTHGRPDAGLSLMLDPFDTTDEAACECDMAEAARELCSIVNVHQQLIEALKYVLDCIELDDVSDMQPVRDALEQAGAL